MPIEFAPPSPNLQGFQIPQPQYTDPLQTLAQLGQVRTQNLQRQQQQMELDSMRGALRAYAESGGDPDKFGALAPKYGVAPGVVVDFKTKVADLAAKRAQTALAQTQTEKAAAEARDQEHDQLYQAYQPVWDAKPEDQQGLITNINARLQSQGWDPKKLMQYTSPEDVQMHRDIYTTHKQIQLAAEQQLKKAQQAKEEAETAKATTETQAAQRVSMINEIRAADQDPVQKVPTPAAWSAILQKYPKAGLPAQPTQQYISRLVESSVPEEKVPEYRLNQYKADMGMVGNSEYDQFLVQYARSLGKKPKDLTADEALASFGAFAEKKQDPDMRAAALAQKNLSDVMKQMQIDQMPTKEQAGLLADDIINHRLAPDQITQIRGRGNGSLGLMVYSAAKEKDPNFNWEQASSEYTLAKSPQFQQTVRYMDYVGNSVDRVIQAADRLNNGKIRSINAVKNWAADQLNGVDIAKFQTDRIEVADAIAKILQGGGTGAGTSDAKLKQAEALIRETDSPAVVRAKMAEIKDLIGIRRNTLTKGTFLENATPGGGGAGAGGGGGTPRINTKAEYDALPAGATYIDAQDNKTYKKR